MVNKLRKSLEGIAFEMKGENLFLIGEVCTLSPEETATCVNGEIPSKGKVELVLPNQNVLRVNCTDNLPLYTMLIRNPVLYQNGKGVELKCYQEI